MKPRGNFQNFKPQFASSYFCEIKNVQTFTPFLDINAFLYDNYELIFMIRQIIYIGKHNVA